MEHYILHGVGSYDNFSSEPMTLTNAKKELNKYIRQLQDAEQVNSWCDIDQDDMTYIVRGDEFFQAYDVRVANEDVGIIKDLRDIIDLCFSADREAEKYQWTLEDMDGLYNCTYVISEKAKKILDEIMSKE